MALEKNLIQTIFDECARLGYTSTKEIMDNFSTVLKTVTNGEANKEELCKQGEHFISALKETYIVPDFILESLEESGVQKKHLAIFSSGTALHSLFCESVAALFCNSTDKDHPLLDALLEDAVTLCFPPQMAATHGRTFIQLNRELQDILQEVVDTIHMSKKPSAGTVVVLEEMGGNTILEKLMSDRAVELAQRLIDMVPAIIILHPNANTSTMLVPAIKMLLFKKWVQKFNPTLLEEPLVPEDFQKEFKKYWKADRDKLIEAIYEDTKKAWRSMDILENFVNAANEGDLETLLELAEQAYLACKIYVATHIMLVSKELMSIELTKISRLIGTVCYILKLNGKTKSILGTEPTTFKSSQIWK